jgi:hypothetical protein
MPLEDPWQDPKTWLAVGGAAIGGIGLVYGMVSNYWNRHESRLDALAKVLQPLTRAAQHLSKANKNRQKCEQLKRSFPNPEAAKEASIRLETFMTEYSESVKDGEKEFKQAESEFLARSFRFPDRISHLTKSSIDALSKFGVAVNDGYFDEADVAFAKYTDEYKSILMAGRGWRLTDPFEGLKKRFKKEKAEPPKVSPYELTEKEMQTVLGLIHKRTSSQGHNTFAVHPPRKLLDHPEIATSNDVIKELEDSVFYVVFQDGTGQILTLTELMFFTSQLIFILAQMRDIAKMMEAVSSQGGETNVKVQMDVSIDQIMRPEMVKVLLSKLDFSKTASDDNNPEQIHDSEPEPFVISDQKPPTQEMVDHEKNLRIFLNVEFDAPEVRELNGEAAMILSQALRGLAASILSGNSDTSCQCEYFKVSGQFMGVSINHRGKRPQTIIASEQVVMAAKLERIQPSEPTDI